MMSASFVGSLDSAYMPSAANDSMLVFEENIATPALDEMPGRMAAQLAYDSESDRVIMFGGAIENLESNYQDTWSFDYNTNTWTNMSPAINPPTIEWHQMTYHSGLDRVVLFGGHLSGGGSDWLNSNETWTYDFNTNTWTDMDPAVAPPGTCGSSMVYDSESDLIVLFGGWHDGGPYGSFGMDTWTYDLVSNTWTNVSTTNQPSSRSWAQMAYDSESDDIVMFGGWENEPELWKSLNDTWTFDANTNTWTEVVTDGPNILGDLEYDSESDRVVFWGGAVDIVENVYVSETWTFDDNSGTWEQMSPDPTPPGRTRGEITYDSESDRIILFGGSLDSGYNPADIMNDCWAYDLNNNLWNNVDWDWQEMTPSISPDSTKEPAMAYDKESDLVVMFGSNGSSLRYHEGRLSNGYNETWIYDYNTNTWTNMSPSIAPVLRISTEMVYDVESDIIILFGGGAIDGFAGEYFYNDTWAYDVNTNTWTNMSPAAAPKARKWHSMTYDTISDRIVMFGGVNESWDYMNDTWTYDYNSNTWTLMSPVVNPAGRRNPVLAFDEESELSVLFGGFMEEYGYLDDTWVYNYTEDMWTERSPTYFPTNRGGLSAVYDSSVDRIILFGGVDGTWSYDYNSNFWFEMNTLNKPSIARMHSGLVFDSESNRTILFGGGEFWFGQPQGDTWAYRYQINPPTAPLNLEVADVGDALGLTWETPITHPETPLTGYNVYRGTSSGVYTLLTELGDVLFYTDTTATAGIRFYYVVAAVTSIGEGDYSNEDSGMVPLVVTDDGVFTFIAYGDTRSSDATAVSAMHETVVSAYLGHDPEMIIHTGDLVNHGGETYQWPLFEASLAAVRDADIPFYSAVGNHEWYTDVYGVNDEDYSNYLDYVDFSDVVDTTGETELYYSFDMEGIHFIILNTVEEWDDDNYTCPAAQMDWLMDDLAGNYETLIVSFHNPMYSIRANRPDRWAQAESLRATFHDLFIQYGVDIVFNGHDHQYYRTVRDGIQYVVTGGGGAPLYDIQTEDTVWQEGDVGFSDYHYLVCSINSVTNQLDVEVFLLDDTIEDTFSLQLPVASEFPLTLTVAVVAGVAIVAVVLMLFVRKRGSTNYKNITVVD
jgi:N-acetylneuraminic acid mutarotase/predicted phosphodiesterase